MTPMHSNEAFSGFPLAEISGVMESNASHRPTNQGHFFIESWGKFPLASATADSGPGRSWVSILWCFFVPKYTFLDFSDLLQYSQTDTYI